MPDTINDDPPKNLPLAMPQSTGLKPYDTIGQASETRVRQATIVADASSENVKCRFTHNDKVPEVGTSDCIVTNQIIGRKLVNRDHSGPSWSTQLTAGMSPARPLQFLAARARSG